MKSPISTIAIVGGGSSGWLSAAILSKRFPRLKITVIESPNVPIIGVGESTLGSINVFLSMLELKDSDWMSYCNATYKLAIKFRNFYKQGETFYYPFGKKDLNHTHNNINDWFIKKTVNPDTPILDFYDSFYSAMPLIYNNKICDNKLNQIPLFNFQDDSAYHMDATLFGEFLKEKFCIPNGVTYIQQHITNINVGNDGYVDSLDLENGTSIVADLYIDCSGFKSMLLEEAMKVQFNSFSSYLPNNRAWVTHIPYTNKDVEMENVTNCTAIGNGWVWNIPLYNRIGSGYVFSTKFITEEQALDEYKAYLDSNEMTVHNQNRSKELEFRLIEIKNGRHDVAWKNNVVGVGLSYAFVEPLESTGLLSVQEMLIALCEILHNEQISKIHIQNFNFYSKRIMEGFKNFVTYHYIPSSRRDTEYWRYITSAIEMDFDDTDINKLTNQLMVQHSMTDNDAEMSDIFVGMHLFSMNPVAYDWWMYGEKIRHNRPVVDYYTSNTRLQDYWNQKKAKIEMLASKLPTHYQYLKANIYNNKE